MLSGEWGRARRSPAPVVLALACGIVLGVLAAAVLDGGKSAHGSTAAGRTVATVKPSSGVAQAKPGKPIAPASAGSNGSTPPPMPTVRAGLLRHLRLGVERADVLGGQAGAAVWFAGDPAPLLAGEDSPARMWSMSKVAVSLAILEADHVRPDRILSGAMQEAITRSSNCAIRRVILGLQEGTGGPPEAIEAFARTLAKAGVSLRRFPSTASAEPECVKYLDAHAAGLHRSALGIAPQFGTVEWTLADAIAFARALGDGVYGQAGEYVLELMREAKKGPLEEPPPPSSPPLDWGAGAIFPSAWLPAYKGGWGGSQTSPPRFLAGQIVDLDVHGTSVAVAAMFFPARQPPNDNPGITVAPQALEEIFREVKLGLE